MSLEAGRNLGGHEIIEPIGKGIFFVAARYFIIRAETGAFHNPIPLRIQLVTE